MRPLAQALAALGISVWYDEFSLRIGDLLSRSIDKGLSQSRYGIVVLSEAFMSKAWPEYELRGLVAKEIDGHSMILPIWHGIDRDAVLAFSPSLADKVAVKTADVSAEQIALQILSVVRSDIYAAHRHAELKRMVSGKALEDLQAELDDARAQLAEFQCPYCGSPLAESQDVPLDMEQKHYGGLRSFCGFVELDGDVQRPCPSDARFPKFEEYEIQCREDHSETTTMFRWTCHAFPRSVMAQGVHLPSTYGGTEEIARQALRGKYEELARPRRAKRI